jgi:hypothetical protein
LLLLSHFSFFLLCFYSLSLYRSILFPHLLSKQNL